MLQFTIWVQDAECYAVLLREIAPKVISAEDLEEAFRLKDPLKRAELVLDWAKKLDCLKFVTPQDIVDVREGCGLLGTVFDTAASTSASETLHFEACARLPRCLPSLGQSASQSRLCCDPVR